MTDRPIIFSGPMVTALLAGRKSMTRRLATSPLAKCQPGDRLYVREAFATHQCAEPRTHARHDGHPWGSPIYRATFSAGLLPECEGFTKWRPSIHMPRWASRLTLTVTDVKIEPLQDITEEDAQAEGAIEQRHATASTAGHSLPPPVTWCFSVDPVTGYRFAEGRTARDAFELLWMHLHGREAWDDNGDVIALSFTVETRNIDTPGAP